MTAVLVLVLLVLTIGQATTAVVVEDHSPREIVVINR